MKNKAIKIVLLLLLVVMACTACAVVMKMSNRTKPANVTLVLKTEVSTAEFWEITMEGVKQAAADYQVNLTITGTSAEKEIDAQIQLMEEVIATKPDVIVLAASDYDRMTASVEDAVKAGIQVITMDSDVNTSVRTCYVASNNREIGRAMGDLLCDKLPEGGKVAIMAHGNSSTAIERVEGAWNYVKDSGAFELVGIYDCNDSQTMAYEYAAELLSQHKDLAAIICSNEVCNVGVANYFAEHNVDHVALVGCDSSVAQIGYLEKGTIQGIVVQQPFNMGYLAIKAAAQLAAGETLPDRIEIPCVSITKENMYDIENQKLLFPFNGNP